MRLTIASRLASELCVARRDESTMNEHFGGSLVAMRLIAYLRKRMTSQSVAAFDADVQMFVAVGRRGDRRAVR